MPKTGKKKKRPERAKEKHVRKRARSETGRKGFGLQLEGDRMSSSNNPPLGLVALKHRRSEAIESQTLSKPSSDLRGTMWNRLDSYKWEGQAHTMSLNGDWRSWWDN